MKPENWPHKWFGNWREIGPTYSSCPSIYDWVDPEEVESYGDDLPKIINYLRTSTVVVATSAIAFPNIISASEKREGSVSYRTDGTWIWFDDLAEYIELNHVALPREFYEDMKKQSFIPPDASNINPDDLDWPALG
jgi:hypothetical protein